MFVTDDGAETDLDLGHYERFKVQRLVRRIVEAIGDQMVHALPAACWQGPLADRAGVPLFHNDCGGAKKQRRLPST